MPLLEQAGVDVRMVNLWKSLPPKVEVEVRVEGEAADGRTPSLNIHSLLTFSAAAVLGAASFGGGVGGAAVR